MSSDITIIPLSKKPDFIDTCVAWSYAQWCCHSEELVEPIENLKNHTLLSIQSSALPITFIAFVKNKIAGMVTLKETEHPDRQDLSPWLGGLFVHPHFRNLGIGKELCLFLEGIALNDYKFDKIHLQTLSPDFYKALGYEQIGLVKDCEGLRPDGQALMIKRL